MTALNEIDLGPSSSEIDLGSKHEIDLGASGIDLGPSSPAVDLSGHAPTSDVTNHPSYIGAALKGAAKGVLSIASGGERLAREGALPGAALLDMAGVPRALPPERVADANTYLDRSIQTPDNIGGKGAEMVGRFVPAVVATAASGGAAAPFVLGATGAAESASSAEQQALQLRNQGQTVSPESERATVVGNAIVGGAAGYVGGKALSIPGGPLVRIPVNTAVQSGLAGAQTAAENVVAKGTIDPQRGLTEGVGPAMKSGAVFGGVLSGVHELAGAVENPNRTQSGEPEPQTVPTPEKPENVVGRGGEIDLGPTTPRSQSKPSASPEVPQTGRPQYEGVLPLGEPTQEASRYLPQQSRQEFAQTPIDKDMSRVAAAEELQSGNRSLPPSTPLAQGAVEDTQGSLGREGPSYRSLDIADSKTSGQPYRESTASSAASVVPKNLGSQVASPEIVPQMGIKGAGEEPQSLYREAGPDELRRLIGGNNRTQNLPDTLYFSNSKELALGQGKNKGILFEFDPKGISVEPDTSKPSAQFVGKQGMSELVSTSHQLENLRSNLKSITIQPDALVSTDSVSRAHLDAKMNSLERNGWTRAVNKDGSITYSSPRNQPAPVASGGKSIQGGSPAEQPRQVTAAGEPQTTSARKSQTTEDRTSLGLDSFDSPERRSWQTVLDTAHSQGVPDRATRIAAEVNEKPRALSDVETAGLVVHASRLKTEHGSLMSSLQKATDPTDIRILSTEANRVEQEFDHLSQALRSSGTEKGRALAAQKLTIDQDMNLVSVLNRAKSAKGTELKSAERARMETLSKQHEQLTQRVSDLESQMNEQAVLREMRQQRQQRYSKMKPEERLADLQDKYGTLRELLKAGCN